jgi:uncharacterized membrane protein YccF (DUF307 family)
VVSDRLKGGGYEAGEDAGAASVIGNVLRVLLCGWWRALAHLV